ncbi:DUF58 domain-containing protein [Pyrococcus abyssi]|uniref:DUF58 domain-containing protein n=1 Tax=Pyrococcus abyssi (strain GE5 / Orsay) TaxID=272844 RepID=Q9UZ66_PYRAB|nr:DUF58 domain-containing protein [Pyrococcus abyssi]CAB50193.1 Hypothetical protein PAB0849 [Pyrococcus abyssi GE5]CCE70727.1 TPA: hypothetical protein PAB0849 [Pyrococcus abyssi GE5]
MKPTGKAYALMTIIWIITILSYFLIRWEGVALTIPFLMVFLLSTIFFKSSVGVEVKREIERSRAIEGSIVEITLKIKPRANARAVLVQDLTPEGLEILGRNSWVLSLKEGEEVKLKYKVKVVRGHHEFLGVRISYRDPFGIFEEDRVVEIYDELIGIPRIEDVITPYSTKGTKITTGPLPSPRLGEGLEFHAVREYMPGDPMKIINWKATAKTGKIMVNEFESERKVDVVVVVDATYKGVDVFDHLMRAAASLLLDALENGTSFGLLISEAVPIWTKVDYGKRHFFKCIDVLSISRPDKNNMIAYQVEHMARTKLPPRAQIIFISPLLTRESEEAIFTLYRLGYKIVTISPDPYSAREPRSREEELALRLLGLKRKARIRKVSEWTIVIDWNVKHPLKAAILSTFRGNVT